MKELMILLPVLNEEDGLETVLNAIPHQSLRELGWSPNIVVVDGNSSDNSREIGEKAGCVVLVQPTKGKGEGIRVGFEYAINNDYDAVVMFDADRTYHPDDMLNMLPLLGKGQIIVGNLLTLNRLRWPHNCKIRIPLKLPDDCVALVEIFDRVDVAKDLIARWALSLFFAVPEKLKDTLTTKVVTTMKVPRQSLI